MLMKLKKMLLAFVGGDKYGKTSHKCYNDIFRLTVTTY